jgi:hypothetical protein
MSPPETVGSVHTALKYRAKIISSRLSTIRIDRQPGKTGTAARYCESSGT